MRRFLCTGCTVCRGVMDDKERRCQDVRVSRLQEHNLRFRLGRYERSEVRQLP